jgi:hypothetical protein
VHGSIHQFLTIKDRLGHRGTKGPNILHTGGLGEAVPLNLVDTANQTAIMECIIPTLDVSDSGEALNVFGIELLQLHEFVGNQLV